LPSSKKEKAPLSVLFATPECAPLVKTGGLGDVSAALPSALLERGIDARVLLPGYPAVLAADPAARELARLEVLGHPVRLAESRLASGVPLIVVDCPTLYVRGGGPYQADDGNDWDDNALRFGVLSKVAAILGGSQSPIAWRPDVIHSNDWPTALAPVYLRAAPKPHAATLLTIHNLAFQGVFEMSEAQALELPPGSLDPEGLEFHGRASFLKGGIVNAGAITTVSPTYAREIQTPELGFGLESVLDLRRESIFGVLNGIDTELWNPQTDPHLAANYGVLTLERKVANKRALKQRFGLEGGDELPLAAIVSRITHQKGIDVIVKAIPKLVAFPTQLVVVGAGDREMVAQLRAAQAQFPQNVGLFIGFDEPLAHLVEGGADMFLMPSRFEPCGMNQMYSQRYGTPPVAHATGGLIDTIDDDVTGFLISRPTPEALVEGVGRAIAAYCNSTHWQRLQVNGMTRDFGWESAARAYSLIYERIRSTS
jgi:starch synthase